MSKNINKYLNMLLEQQKTELLAIALNLKVFKFLEEEEHTSNSLSKVLDIDEKNTEVLLNSLVLLDLLYKKGEIYKNEQLTKEFFISGTKSYCGDVFLHRKEMLNHARKMLSSLVKDGLKEEKELSYPKKWAAAAKGTLRQEQQNLISSTALNIVKEIEGLDSFNKMLDLGCSAGIVGLELIKNHPNINGTFFDYKEVIEVVQTHIKEYDLENKTSTICGNIEEDDIGSGYDLIWCSNIFYFFKDKEKVLEKIYKALNPGGVLVSAHVEIDKNDKSHLESYFYFLFMSMQGRSLLEPNEVSKLCKDTGFKDINCSINYELPMTPTKIVIAKK